MRPVRQKKDICFRIVKGANNKIAKQIPVEMIAMSRPEKI